MADNQEQNIDGLSLVVAWKSGTNYQARHVNINQQVAVELRNAVARSIVRLAEGPGREYDPGGDQEDAPYLTVPHTEILDDRLVNALRPGPALDLVDLNDLEKKPLYCYAAVSADNIAGGQIICIRKGSPAKLIGPRILTTWIDGALHLLTGPIVALDDMFHVVVRGDQMMALSYNGFEKLFKNSDVVLGRVDTWIDQAFENLPITQDARERFKVKVIKNSFIRGKLEAACRRPHIREMTLEMFRHEVIAQGLDEDDLIHNAAIHLTEDNAMDVLRILNEDYYTGGLSGDHFTSSKKSRRK